MLHEKFPESDPVEETATVAAEAILEKVMLRRRYSGETLYRMTGIIAQAIEKELARERKIHAKKMRTILRKSQADADMFEGGKA